MSDRVLVRGPGSPPLFELAAPDLVLAGDGPGVRTHPPDALVHIGDTTYLPDTLLHNLAPLRQLTDPRLGELLLAPVAQVAPLFRLEHHTPAAAPVDVERFADAWRVLVSVLGPLPWSVVVARSQAHAWPRALSLPGVVILASALTPVTARTLWLYLVHEVLHQWFGNLARIAEADRPDWEATLDALAWLITEQTLGAAAGRAFASTYRRHTDSAVPELRDRGRRVLAVRDVLAGDLRDTPFPSLAGQAADAVRRGRPRMVLPPIGQLLGHVRRSAEC